MLFSSSTWSTSGGRVSSAPRMTSPVNPSMLIQSPSSTVASSTLKLRVFMSMSSAPQPTMQTLPI